MAWQLEDRLQRCQCLLGLNLDSDDEIRVLSSLRSVLVGDRHVVMRRIGAAREGAETTVNILRFLVEIVTEVSEDKSRAVRPLNSNFITVHNFRFGPSWFRCGLDGLFWSPRFASSIMVAVLWMRTLTNPQISGRKRMTMAAKVTCGGIILGAFLIRGWFWWLVLFWASCVIEGGDGGEGAEMSVQIMHRDHTVTKSKSSQNKSRNRSWNDKLDNEYIKWSVLTWRWPPSEEAEEGGVERRSQDNQIPARFKPDSERWTRWHAAPRTNCIHTDNLVSQLATLLDETRNNTQLLLTK